MSVRRAVQSWSRMGHSLSFFTWLPLVDKHTLSADFVAGLTGAIIVLPQGVAFATIAGMPPEYGLYAAMAPTIIAALFGSSWHLVAGPSTTASLILASALGAFAEPRTPHYVELALTLAFMVGAMQLALGAFRAGALVNFISHSVIIGFTAGVGVIIIITQTKHFFGLTLPQGMHVFQIPPYIAAHFNEINAAAAVVGLITLAAGVGVKRYLPRIPFMIVAVLAGSLAGTAFNHFGAHVAVVGALPSHLPRLSAPTFDLAELAMLLPTALALTISALNESISIARAIAVRSGQHVDSNREFIGQGMANVVGSFFSSYVVSSSFNRSALNYEVGAKTPVSALVGGVSLMIIIVVAAPLAAYLPYPAMAASLFLIGWSLIDRKNIAQIARTSRTETGVLVATLATALFWQVQIAILAGVALSLVVYLYRTSNPRVVHRVPDPANPSRKMTEPRPDLPECPQFHIIRFNGSLFFGAVNAFKEELLSYENLNPGCKHLAIIMAGVNFIDVAGAEALAQMARRRRERGGSLYLIHVNAVVQEVLEKGGYIDAIGRENIFFSKTKALRHIYSRLNYDVCQGCKLRVFVECGRVGKQEPEPEEESRVAAA
jgi:SulP family sulfate permease